MKPIVKWVGGKTKLLPELLRRMPVSGAYYYEPFAGGAALFFRLGHRYAVLNDANPELMDLYRVVAVDPAGLVARMRKHAMNHSTRYYYRMRARWNERGKTWGMADRAALFLYLNKTCFNGLWRVNRAGEFNVPIGRYDNPRICVPEELYAAHAALSHAALLCGDYREAVAGAGLWDLVYLDPPYDSCFTSYTPGGFSEEDQRALAVTAKDLVDRGCFVMLSNTDTPLIRDLYTDGRFDLSPVEGKVTGRFRSDTNRGVRRELIITSKSLAELE